MSKKEKQKINYFSKKCIDTVSNMHSAVNENNVLILKVQSNKTSPDKSIKCRVWKELVGRPDVEVQV